MNHSTQKLDEVTRRTGAIKLVICGTVKLSFVFPRFWTFGTFLTHTDACDKLIVFHSVLHDTHNILCSPISFRYVHMSRYYILGTGTRDLGAKVSTDFSASWKVTSPRPVG